jgi:4'-phosphopantetheinyl transferase
MVRSDQVHVIRIRLDEFTSCRTVLDEAEQLRANRFRYERDRRRFSSAHSAVRTVVGHILGVPPASIQFAITPHGKPMLTHGSLDLRFNLARANERALIAVSIGFEIGVDIEVERVVDVLAVADYAFTPSERSTLRQLPPAERVDAFYRCWTRKESFVKARGDGLSFPLDRFEVSLEHDTGTALLACPAAPEDLARWTIMPLEVEPGYYAALTVEGCSRAVVCWDSVESFMCQSEWSN